MEIIDSQVHTWERDTPQYPWHLNYADPARNAIIRSHFSEHVVPMDRLIAAMDAAGVDAGIATVPSIYGWDNSYTRAACARYPDRLGMIALVNPDASDLDEQMQQLKKTPGVLGIRIMIVAQDLLVSVQSGSRRRVIAAAERHDVALCLYPPGHLQHVMQIARDFPNLRIVLDHLGLPQPPINIGGTGFDNMFGGWEHLIDLAACDNVAVKISGFPSMSKAPYPYQDLSPRIHQLIDAYGLPRLFWGTDFTRVDSLLTYEQGVHYLLESPDFSTAEKEALMGGSLRRYFQWPAPGWAPHSGKNVQTSKT